MSPYSIIFASIWESMLYFMSPILYSSTAVVVSEASNFVVVCHLLLFVIRTYCVCVSFMCNVCVWCSSVEPAFFDIRFRFSVFRIISVLRSACNHFRLVSFFFLPFCLSLFLPLLPFEYSPFFRSVPFAFSMKQDCYISWRQ